MAKYCKINLDWEDSFHDRSVFQEIVHIESNGWGIIALLQETALLIEESGERYLPFLRITEHFESVFDAGVDVSLAICKLVTYGIASPSAFSRGYVEIRKGVYTVVDDSAPNVSKDYRQHADEIYARDGHKCIYCGSPHSLSLDHFIPQSKGGSHDKANLVTACRSCNSSKGDKLFHEWLSVRNLTR